MFDRIRSKLSFSNTISLIALFVALGGTGYAAIALPKNSVGPREIKRNAVRASDIKRNAVRASEIKRNAVRQSEIKTGGVGAAEVEDGSLTALEFAPGLVENLNADLLDGLEAADFLLKGAKAADSELLDGLEATAFLLKGEKAADSELLDGLEPAAIGRELFASVDANGAAQPTLGSNNGATEAIRINAGNYRVDFGDRDLTACSYQVSSGEFNENHSTQIEIDATDNTRLAVSVHDADAGTNVDADFNVAAHC